MLWKFFRLFSYFTPHHNNISLKWKKFDNFQVEIAFIPRTFWQLYHHRNFHNFKRSSTYFPPLARHGSYKCFHRWFPEALSEVHGRWMFDIVRELMGHPNSNGLLVFFYDFVSRLPTSRSDAVGESHTGLSYWNLVKKVFRIKKKEKKGFLRIKKRKKRHRFQSVYITISWPSRHCL